MTTYDKILAELQKSTELAKSATEGPWNNEGELVNNWRMVVAQPVANSEADSAFIASARTDLPKRDEALREACRGLVALVDTADIETAAWANTALENILSILTSEPK